MTVVNGIPSGGYFYIKIPKDITMDVASTSSHCSINININIMENFLTIE